jgi:hypothetical protein
MDLAVPITEVLLQLERLATKTPEEEALKRSLLEVGRDLERVDLALMQIVDTDQFVDPAYRDLSDQLVTQGMGLFSKLSNRTRE